MMPCCPSSLRSSERGLKFQELIDRLDLADVAPFVGAWIEIQNLTGSTQTSTSLRSSERGLK